MRLKFWPAVLWVLLLLFGQMALQLHSLDHLETPSSRVLAGDDEADSCPLCLIALPLQALMTGVAYSPSVVAGDPVQIPQLRLFAGSLRRAELPAIRAPPTIS